MSFEQAGLQNIRQISPDAERCCRFQTLLVVQPAVEDPDISTLFQGDMENIAVEGMEAFSTYAVLLHCEILASGGLAVRVSFDSNVISEHFIRRLIHQLQSVLEQICSLPLDTRVDEIQTVSKEDLQDIWCWNATVPQPVEDACVHDIFQSVAQLHPAADAICAWDGKLTYGQLDDLSTHLAYHLAAVGIGSDVVVPLYFEKSLYTAIAIMGVMKAGGACVLLGTYEERSLYYSYGAIDLDHLLTSVLRCL